MSAIIRFPLILLLFPLFAGLLRAETPQDQPSPVEPATLTVWQRDVAVFRVPIANISPELRRDTALQRLRDLPDFALYDELTTERISLGNLNGISFLCGKRLLFTLIQEDVDPTSDTTLEETADKVLEKLKELRVAKRDQRSLPVILQGIGVTIAATVLFAGLLWGITVVNRASRRFFIRKSGRLKHLKHRNLDLRPAFLQLSRRLTGFTFAAIGLGAAYIWLTAILAQFPYTSPWATVLGKHVANLGSSLFQDALSAVPNLLVVIAIFFLTRGSARLTDQILRSFESQDNQEHILAKDTARATRRIATVLIWIFGLVIAYPYIPGSSSEAFKGISVLLGLMISLGSTGLVNQVMSGFVVLYSGAVRTGEFARVGDVEGTITEIGLLSTKVLTPKNEYITVPNSVIIGKDTLNYSRMTEDRRTELSTSLTIGYDTPWRQVHELLLLAADRTPGIRDNPEPHVVQTALSDFYAEYSLRFVPADISRKGAVLSALHQQIQDAFHQAGVQIMSPNFVAQPETPVIPAAPGE